MEKFFVLIAMAILIEGIVTYVTELSQEFHIGLVVPILLGLVVALAYGIDIPKILGITAKVQYIGEILTGIILARGSNYIYDLIGHLTGDR